MPRSKLQAVLRYLAQARDQEQNPWFRDDYQIAYLTVLYNRKKETRQSVLSPFARAVIKVLHCHPEQLWLRLQARREWIFRPTIWPKSNSMKPISPLPQEIAMQKITLQTCPHCSNFAASPHPHILELWLQVHLSVRHPKKQPQSQPLVKKAAA